MLKNKPKRFDNMNVIPLIDVMLVLLAIVLMTASFIVKDNLNIELPETSNTESYIPPENLTIVYFLIDANNQFFMDEKPLSFVEIEQALNKLTKEQPVTLQVDKGAKFGPFVKLVDALKGQGLNNLTILTQSNKE